MAVLEMLSEEEAYLVAILTDPSGLDQAEFLWHDPRNDDGCFRAWPFQWSWWRSDVGLQIDQCGRSVGKSESIKVRACAFPFLHPGQEMVITGPEGIHVDLITDKIERQILDTRLLRELLTSGRSGIKHRPFHMNFANGSRIMGRIPHRDGSGVKGIHPVWLELDEAQDYPRNGWTEINETLTKGHEGAVWRAHGVTRGVRDKFFDFTQENPENPWHVHRYTQMHRPPPFWSDEQRDEAIKTYGSRDDPDYRRNIVGAHGDATNPLFVLHRLMRCVEDDQSSSFNIDEYTHLSLKDSQLQDYNRQGLDIVDVLQLPTEHLSKYDVFWIGMDIGLTTDPTEILVFAEYHPNSDERRAAKAGDRDKAIPAQGVSRLKCICRISLMRIGHPDQVKAVLHIIEHYRPRAFSMDKTGIGLNVYQDVQDRIEKAADSVGRDRARRIAESIRGYNFSEKVLVDLDETIELGENPDPQEAAKAAGIARNVLEYSTDKLREYVDNERLWLPWDREMVGEFQGQTFTYSKATMDLYGRRRRIFSEGEFHALDAARMAVMGHAQASIEEFMRKPKEDNAPVLAVFVTA